MKYKFEKVVNEKYAVWYMAFPKRKGNRIGVYKILDLYKGTRECRFAFRYRPREGQTQEQSDNAIIMNCVSNFYRSKAFMGNRSVRGNRGLTHA
jgi:hypothetical protein